MAVFARCESVAIILRPKPCANHAANRLLPLPRPQPRNSSSSAPPVTLSCRLIASPARSPSAAAVHIEHIATMRHAVQERARNSSPASAGVI